MDYLNIACIAKDETNYIAEFCAFHRVCGVEHIYIYDNESAIPIKNTLKAYVDEGFVSVIDAPGRGIQMKVYADAARELAEKTTWLAIIDADEFLTIQKPEIDDIKIILAEYDKPNIGAFQVSWRLFGSNGHKTKPNGLTIENFTAATPTEWHENLHTKSICRPERCRDIAPPDPHHMRLKPGFISVNADHTPMTGAFSPCFTTSSGLQLNHYVIRSLEEFERKIKKGRIDTEVHLGKSIADFSYFDNQSIENDETALRFVEAVKAEMSRIKK